MATLRPGAQRVSDTVSSRRAMRPGATQKGPHVLQVGYFVGSLYSTSINRKMAQPGKRALRCRVTRYGSRICAYSQDYDADYPRRDAL